MAGFVELKKKGADLSLALPWLELAWNVPCFDICFDICPIAPMNCWDECNFLRGSDVMADVLNEVQLNCN